MKKLFGSYCFAACILFCTSCKNNADDKQTNDTTITSGNVADTNERAPSQPKEEVINKTDYAYHETVVITGKLSIETFFGAPGFGENPATDEKEEEYLLLLEKPINVIGPETPAGDSEESKYNITKIQLLYNKDSIDMGRYLGSSVVLTGDFFGAHTGHHHTDVVMDVSHADFK